MPLADDRVLTLHASQPVKVAKKEQQFEEHHNKNYHRTTESRKGLLVPWLPTAATPTPTTAAPRINTPTSLVRWEDDNNGSNDMELGRKSRLHYSTSENSRFQRQDEQERDGMFTRSSRNSRPTVAFLDTNKEYEYDVASNDANSNTNSNDNKNDAIQKALLRRAFHLPAGINDDEVTKQQYNDGSRTWWEDWRQYIGNTHPLWGLCCAVHPHPVGFAHRCIMFTTSVVAGIAASIAAMCWSFWFSGGSLQDVVLHFTISFGNSSGDSSFAATTDASTSTFGETDQETRQEFDLTYCMIYLWTWISLAHAMHDLLVWYLCCCGSFVTYMLWLLMWIGGTMVLIATLFSFQEAAASDLDDDGVHDEAFGSTLSTLVLFTSVELIASWMVWFPIAATVLFSGILGCFRIPFLGGRPQEVYASQVKSQSRQPNRGEGRRRRMGGGHYHWQRVGSIDNTMSQNDDV